MSAVERPQDATLEHVATVTPLPSRVTPDSAAVASPALPSRAAVPALPWWAAILHFITPPDIWSDDRPSLRKLCLYGRYGKWTHQDGPLRLAGTVYSWFSALVHGLLYAVLWIVERPARLAVAAVLGTFIYLTLN